MRLLIVDDNPAVRRLICHIVRPIASEIHECVDGSEALAAYSAKQPDLVLMDIRMRNVDGIAATKQIVAFDPSAKVVMVSDYDEPDLRAVCTAAGACGYAPKSNLLDLVRLLEELLKDN